MTDVAKRAGVHQTTVSMALRNHPSLPASTRKRLRALAEQMGYEPDPVLRALIDYRYRARAPQHTPVIAYVTNWNTRWGWKESSAHSDFYMGATARAPELGYRIEHFWLGEPALSHRRMSNLLFARGINGVIVASQRYEVDAPLEFDWPKFGAVKIDFIPHDPALHAVTNDQRAIIRLAMRKVQAAGYRRIGFVMDQRWDHGVDNAWSSGFLGEQQMLPIEERVPLLLFGDLSGSQPAADQSVPRDLLDDWLNRHRPDAVISAGVFVRDRFLEMGISVPQDFAYADILLGDFDGKTAGVRQNCRRVGELAVEILTRQLQQHTFGLPELPTATLVEGTWFDGESLPGRVATQECGHLVEI